MAPALPIDDVERISDLLLTATLGAASDEASVAARVQEATRMFPGFADAYPAMLRMCCGLTSVEGQAHARRFIGAMLSQLRTLGAATAAAAQPQEGEPAARGRSASRKRSRSEASRGSAPAPASASASASASEAALVQASAVVGKMLADHYLPAPGDGAAGRRSGGGAQVATVRAGGEDEDDDAEA